MLSGVKTFGKTVASDNSKERKEVSIELPALEKISSLKVENMLIVTRCI